MDTAFQLVSSSRGLEETKELATKYSEAAMESRVGSLLNETKWHLVSFSLVV